MSLWHQNKTARSTHAALMSSMKMHYFICYTEIQLLLLLYVNRVHALSIVLSDIQSDSRFGNTVVSEWRHIEVL